jgi:hypothetical protein
MTLYETAKRKARYGHKDWIVWTDRTGTQHAERLSPASMKRCLLDVGTNGRFSKIGASTGISLLGYWRIGINIINQFKYA